MEFLKKFGAELVNKVSSVIQILQDYTFPEQSRGYKARVAARKIAHDIHFSDVFNVLDVVAPFSNSLAERPLAIPPKSSSTPMNWEQAMALCNDFLAQICPCVHKKLEELQQNNQLFHSPEYVNFCGFDGVVKIEETGTAFDMRAIAHEICHATVGRSCHMIFHETLSILIDMLAQQYLAQRGHNADFSHARISDLVEDNDINYAINCTIGMCKEIGFNLQASKLDRGLVASESRIMDARAPKNIEVFESGAKKILKEDIKNENYNSKSGMVAYTVSHSIGTVLAINLFKKIQNSEIDFQTIMNVLCDDKTTLTQKLDNLAVTQDKEEFVENVYEYATKCANRKIKNPKEPT